MANLPNRAAILAALPKAETGDHRLQADITRAVVTLGDTAITPALTAGSATAANCATTINLVIAALQAKGLLR
jgi:hypothetical protein